jgi:hypothetical protein
VQGVRAWTMARMPTTASIRKETSFSSEVKLGVRHLLPHTSSLSNLFARPAFFFYLDHIIYL